MMDSKEAVPALGALAQETRLAIFRLLVERGPEGLPAGRIAERLDVPAATMSFHLMQLSHAGLVVSRRESRLVIYAVNAERVSDLIRFLTEDCCGGRPELCLPAAAACAPAPRAIAGKAAAPKTRRKRASG